MKNFKISKICSWIGFVFFAVYLILISMGLFNIYEAKNPVIVFFGITGLLLISFSFGIRMNLEEEKQGLETKKHEEHL